MKATLLTNGNKKETVEVLQWLVVPGINTCHILKAICVHDDGTVDLEDACNLKLIKQSTLPTQPRSEE